MAVQLSVGVRNARLDAIETTIGTSPVLRIRTGAPPATCATARTGTVLSAITLPSDWLANAASGSKALLGTWDQPSAAASGTAGYFDIGNAGDTAWYMQGTVTATGGGGDMTLSNTNIASGQDVSVTSFTLTDANA